MNRYFFGTLFFLIILPAAWAQTPYAAHSVLATGSWFRLGVTREGIYKVDVAMLQAMGVNAGGLASGSLRLYGNGGAMLEEAPGIKRVDDLAENAIAVDDGGDGVMNGNDYFLFYAAGTARWEKDSTQQRFRHRKNVYGDTAFYYLTIGGTGKRIQTANTGTPATVVVNSFNERLFYENDLVNLLSSGKEWYGEEFSNNPGSTLSRAFAVDASGWLTNAPVSVTADMAGRSVGGSSSFRVVLNGQALNSVTIPGVSGYFLDHYATQGGLQQDIVLSQSPGSLSFSFQPANANAQGWLNWWELQGRKALAMNGTAPLFFRDWASVGTNAVAQFNITTGAVQPMVWDITDPLAPARMPVSVTGGVTGFINEAGRLHEYVAFAAGNVPAPVALGKLENQDLHHSSPADYIIISHPSLLTQAQRLAQFHAQREGLRTVVVSAEEVFHEFGGGMRDPAAIRDFVKMYVDKAGADSSRRPSSLLLFGAASYDYRNRVKENTNLVPGYESDNTLDPLATYTSDDFFALLDGSVSLQLAVGRIPARTPGEAKTLVDKIIRYHAPESLGSWRNETVYVADDKDNNLHLTDAEALAADAAAANALFNQQKIYLDAYPLSSGSGGARYPAVNDAIVNQLYNGALIFNYSGHGSYQRLAEEAVLSFGELNRLNNADRLPLFITASCDFAPFDDPQKNSLGAAVLTGSANGAIALLSTTRLVFAYSNKVINDNYLKIALQPDTNGYYLTLGESVRRAKNGTAQGFGDVLNTRKFALLGDPAMRLAIPSAQIKITALNGQPLRASDTLRSLQEYRFKGIVTDAAGNILPGFNGTVYPTIFDRPQTVKTLGNDPASPVTSFQQQSRVLYKGSASVQQGQFEFAFVVPRDISPQSGNTRISLYAHNGVQDAAGINNRFPVVKDNTPVTDPAGPSILLFLNDTNFLNGGLTDERPLLLARLADSSGINSSGNGIGHDIIAVLDGDESHPILLNDFYTAEKDTYRRGSIRYQLPVLTAGKHRLRLKAWDVANNSGEAGIDFEVAKREHLRIGRLLNFPNPFSGSTRFSFEHNQPGAALWVDIRIYSLSGQLVRHLGDAVNTDGSRNVQLNWDGRDEQGRKLEKGIYIYQVVIRSATERYETARQLILL